MSTITLDRPAVTVVPTTPIGQVAADGTVTFFGRLRDSLASAFRTSFVWVKDVLRTFKLDSVADGARSIGAWLLSKAQWALGKVSILGRGNLIGAALTCGAGRDMLRTTAATAYRTTKSVVAFALRPAAWLLRKVRLGVVVDKTAYSLGTAEFVVTAKADQALAWLDRNEYSVPMTIVRRICQLNILLNLIRIFRPGFGGWLFFLLTAFIPSVGVRQADNPAEASTIERAKAMLSTVTSVGKAAAETSEAVVEVVEQVEAIPAPENTYVLALKDSGEFKKGILYSAVRAYSDTGAPWLSLPNGQQTPETDLDTTMWEVGHVSEVKPGLDTIQAKVEEVASRLDAAAPKPGPAKARTMPKGRPTPRRQPKPAPSTS